MPAADDPHHADAASRGPATGRHGLGPHVVGQRVVVRRLLRGETGPSGGPAMTDLLGTCLSWDDDRCVVQPDDGAPVSIALADVVSGKPVPPRPAVRHRAAPAEAQRHGFALFDDLETRELGAWTLRRSAGHRARRANSCLAFGPSGVPDDVAQVVAFYDRPVAAVLADSPEAARLLDLGWVPESGEADTVFMLGSLARAQRALPRASRDAADDVRLDVRGPTATAHHLEGATGVAALDGDWIGFRSIEVPADRRRRGLGTAVMAALLEWGAEQGARTAFLQVLEDNTPAVALYEGLGLAKHHRYRYLTPAPAGA